MKKRLFAVGSLAALCPSLAAQQVVPFQGDSHETAWPSSVNDPGSFGRAVVGRLTPDDVPDVAQLDGATLHLLPHADDFFIVNEMASGVDDVCLMPGAGVGGADAVAVVGASGLRRIWYDGAQNQFSSASIDSGAWAGALIVRSGDVNDDGVADLVGIASDEQTVLIQLADSTGTNFSAATGFVADADVRDLLVLPWDTDSVHEIALLTDLAVDVHDADGVQLNSFTAATPGGTFCAIAQAGQARERIVWITEYAPPALQLLAVLEPGGASDIVNLGALDAFAVVPTDTDLDGDDDILISHRFSYELLWIENERTPQNPTGPSFQMAGDQVVFQVEVPGPAPQNEAWPAVGDLDGDGDDDIAFSSDGSLTYQVFRGDTVDQDDLRVSIEAADYALPGGNGRLTLTLDAPATIPATATHLEARAWRQPRLEDPVDEDPVAVLSVPLPASWPATIAIDLPETTDDFEAVYTMGLRLVDQDGAGAVVGSHPIRGGTFSIYDDDRTTLQLEPQARPETEVSGFVAAAEQDPTITKRKIKKITPPPPPAVKVPKFE